MMKIKLVHSVEGLQALRDRVLQVRDLDAKRSERIVAAGVWRAMLPNAAAYPRVKLRPGVFRLGLRQRRMPRAIREVDDRQSAAVLEIANEV